MTPEHLKDRLDLRQQLLEALGERNRARRWAVHLEQENARLTGSAVDEERTFGELWEHANELGQQLARQAEAHRGEVAALTEELANVRAALNDREAEIARARDALSDYARSTTEGFPLEDGIDAQRRSHVAEVTGLTVALSEADAEAQRLRIAWEAQRDRADRLSVAAGRARKMHSGREEGEHEDVNGISSVNYCVECGSTDDPCPTIRALDSEAEELTCGCGIAPDGAPGASGCSAGCMVPYPTDRERAEQAEAAIERVRAEALRPRMGFMQNYLPTSDILRALDGQPADGGESDV